MSNISRSALIKKYYDYNYSISDSSGLSLEFMGPQGGTHWVKYKSEEEVKEAYKKEQLELEEFIQIETKKIIKAKANRIADQKASANTIGNLFPNIFKT